MQNQIRPRIPYAVLVLSVLVHLAYAQASVYESGELILSPDEYDDSVEAVQAFWSSPSYLQHPPDVTIKSSDGSNISIVGNGVPEVRPLVRQAVNAYAAYRQPYAVVDTNNSIYSGNLNFLQLLNASRALAGQFLNRSAVTEVFARSFTKERQSYLDYLITPRIYNESSLLLHLPLMVSGIFIAYFLPQINDAVLVHFNKSQLQGIFNGTIKTWKDSRLRSTENDAWWFNETLQDNASSATIQLFVPAGDSVATAVLSTYLFGRNASFLSGWKARFGKSANITEANSTIGTIGACLQINYSLCIGQYYDSQPTVLNLARLKNAQGRYVELSLNSAGSVAQRHFTNPNTSALGDPLYADLVDTLGNDSYPLTFMYYMAIRSSSTYLGKPIDCAQMVNLLRFIRFLYSNEEVRLTAARLGSVFVTAEAYAEIRKKIKRLRCGPDKTIAWVLLKQQIQDDLDAQIDTLTETLLALLSIPSLLLMVYCIWRFWRFVRILQRVRDGIYKVPSAAIFLTSRQHTLTDRFKGVIASRRVVDYHTPKSYVHIMYFGRWKAYQVMLRPCSMNIHRLSQTVKRRLVEMMEISSHPRVAKFYGLTEVKNGRYFVSNFCPYGDLRSIIIAKEYTFSLNMKYSLAGDIANGMEFLHKNGILHGNLRSCAIYIEADFSAKVGDWEYNTLHRLQGSYFPQEIRLAQTLTLFEQTAFYPWLYWTAPEVLQCGMLGTAVILSKAQDVYSFGVILGEIFGEEAAYQRYQDSPYNFTPTEIITKILSGNLRPRLSSGNDAPVSVTRLMNFCWAFSPRDRPTFHNITKVLRLVVSPRKPISDLVVIESQLLADKLKKKAKRMEHRYEMVSTSFHKYSRILVPFPIWRRIYIGHMRPPLNRYEDAVVLRCALSNYDAIIAANDPQIAMDTINLMQRVFEEMVEKNGRIYRLYQDGAAVVAVGGAPFGLELDPVHSIAQTALDYVVWANNSRAPSQPALKIRLGIHSGAVAAGCVDYAAAHYVLFGELMKTVFNIERVSEPYRVLISEDFNDKLRQLAKVYVKYKVAESSRTVRGYDKKTFWLIGSNVYDQQYLLDDILYGKDELDVDNDGQVPYGSELAIIADCHTAGICRPDNKHHVTHGDPTLLDSAAVIRGLKKRKAAVMKMPPPHVLKAQILDNPSHKKHRKKGKHGQYMDAEPVKIQPFQRPFANAAEEMEPAIGSEQVISPADLLVGIHHRTQIQQELDPDRAVIGLSELHPHTNQAFLVQVDSGGSLKPLPSDYASNQSLFQESAVDSEGQRRIPMRLNILNSPAYGSIFAVGTMESTTRKLENIPERPYVVKTKERPAERTNKQLEAGANRRLEYEGKRDAVDESLDAEEKDTAQEDTDTNSPEIKYEELPTHHAIHVKLTRSSSRAISVYADLPSIHSDIDTSVLIPSFHVGLSHHESATWVTAQQDQDRFNAEFSISDDALPLQIDQTEIKADAEPLKMMLSVNAPFQPSEEIVGFGSANTNRDRRGPVQQASQNLAPNSTSKTDTSSSQENVQQ